MGPSNADRLFGSLQENLIIGFIEALESLKGNSVDTVITRLDSLGLFQSLTGNNEALLGQISNPLKVNVELMVKMAIEDLLNVAMIPNETASLLYTIDNETALEDQGQVSALSGALENLAKTFVIHSGWDWERVVGGLESFEQRQTIRKAATEKILDMYEKVWKVIGKGQTTEGAQGESKIHPPKAIKPLFE